MEDKRDHISVNTAGHTVRHQAAFLQCVCVGLVTHLLGRLYPGVLHVQHLEALEQDVLGGVGHRGAEGGVQRAGGQAAQVLDGELGHTEALFV